MKETYYLKHDYNARNDEKILKLRSKYGAEGVGIYWMLIEKLAESSEGRLCISDIECIAYELHTQYERIADVIQSFQLFEISEKYFWSKRLMTDLRERNFKSEKAKLSVKIRWDRKRAYNKSYNVASKASKNTNVIQGEDRIGEDRIGKEKIREEKEIENVEKDFDKFWNIYPNKRGKLNASKVWNKLNQKDKDLILEVLPIHCKQEQWIKNDGAFIPHASTWLNGRRWEDELIKETPTISKERQNQIAKENLAKFFSSTNY